MNAIILIKNTTSNFMTWRHKYFVIGSLLLVGYGLQLAFGIRIDLLVHFQENNVYKQLTGFLLFGLLAFQFWLGVSRNTKDYVTRKKRLLLHKWLGVGVLVALYVHSISLGYAYQSVLVIVFLLNCFIGVCNSEVLRLRGFTYKLWVITHVSLANISMGLVFYHIYITYKFT